LIQGYSTKYETIALSILCLQTLALTDDLYNGHFHSVVLNSKLMAKILIFPALPINMRIKIIN